MPIKVILNAQSKNGSDRHLVSTLKERLASLLVGIERTSCREQAIDSARRAANAGVDTIVAVGGDGTVNGVINAIAGTDVALGIVPTGTANDLASHYAIPKKVSEACDTILERRVRRADLISVNGWYYGTAGGLGLPCKIAEIANDLKRQNAGKRMRLKLGSIIYVLAATSALARGRHPRNLLTIRWDNRSFVTDAVALMVNNQAFAGKRFFLSPGALNDDGAFDVCLIERPESRAQILFIALKSLFGRHVDSPHVKSWRASELVVEAEEPATFFGDGELFDRTCDFRIKIVPRALSILTPERRLSKRDV